MSNGATISVEAADANGGDVTVNAGDRISVSHSGIITRAAGAGGNIFLGSRDATTGAISPTFITLNDAEINANAIVGNGGNITLLSREFVTSPGTIITATSEQSSPGEVDVSAGIADLAGGLVRLPSALAGDAATLRELCGLSVVGDESSFIVTGRGGTPLTPDGLQPSFDLPRPTR
jgi:large exoprotein involved in heme utilization and adhesion